MSIQVSRRNENKNPIREIRLILDLTSHQFAKLLYISVSTLTSLEWSFMLTFLLLYFGIFVPTSITLGTIVLVSLASIASIRLVNVLQFGTKTARLSVLNSTHLATL
jgi:hypothetical protein